MITTLVRTVLLFTQMADGMMFHVHGTLDPFVKLASMLIRSDTMKPSCFEFKFDETRLSS